MKVTKEMKSLIKQARLISQLYIFFHYKRYDKEKWLKLSLLPLYDLDDHNSKV